MERGPGGRQYLTHRQGCDFILFFKGVILNREIMGVFIKKEAFALRGM